MTVALTPPIRLAFFGTPEFAVPSLSALNCRSGVVVPLVVTQPDAPQGRGKKLAPSPIKEFAVANSIPVFQPSSLKREHLHAISVLEEHGPFDGAVVAAFGQILPPWLLDFFGRKCINVHASLLPALRGAAPIVRAILAGHHESGVSLMQMEEGLDTGAVFTTHSCPINDTTTGGALHDTLAQLGATALTEFIIPIIAGQISATPQCNDSATYAAKITASDRCIDWHQDATTAARMIRAFAPHPGAFTEYQSAAGTLERLKVGTAFVASTTNSSDKCPGTIITSNEKSVVVQCGTGAIAITQLQRAGRTMLPWSEVRKANLFTVGMKLGAPGSAIYL